MAVYNKNVYNKRPINIIERLGLAVACLFLLCSAMDCTIFMGDNSERIRHQHQHQKPDEYMSQLEKTMLEDSSKRPMLSCPNCLYKTDKLRSQSDSIRLEAIKHQILMKLGLKDKPNVTHHLPREVILETLYRAEESGGFLGDDETHDEDDYLTTSTRTNNMEQDFDDFYGRTSEIITFAEQGQTLNDNRLLEFRLSREPDQTLAGQELRVRSATLWLRVDLRGGGGRPGRGRQHQCQPTLWVFSVNRDVEEDVTQLGTQDLSEMTQLSASQPVQDNISWHKFDLTATIREWYSEARDRKLRLLVDCSGCCKHLQVHTFDESDRMNDPNRPFLVVHTDPNTTKRVRRRAVDCTGAVKNQCCKQRFYVSFKDMGWDDWVIAPNGYYANYCRGDCGGTHRTPDTFLNYYTHVIEEVRKTHQLSGMQPCCAPLKFSSMSLIYFGPDSNIIKRDLPKMVVDECGCP